MHRCFHFLHRRRILSRRLALVTAICLSLIGSTIPFQSVAADTVITAAYPNFTATNIKAFQTNGAAGLSGSSLLLTPSAAGQSGSAFWKNKVNLENERSFSTNFSIQINDPGTSAGADGIVFVIQTVSSTSGGAGGGIGYSGITPSLGIEFDTYQNTEFGDPDGNHVGIDLNGNVTSLATASLSSYSINLESGNPIYVWADYNGTLKSLEIRMGNTNSRSASSLVISQSVDLAATFGPDVYIGFTAGTGGSYDNQIVNDFYFNNNYLSAGIDPSSTTYTQAPASIEMGAAPSSISANGIATSQITATAKDFDGNPVPGVMITFSTDQGTISPTSATTGSNGQTSATLTSSTLVGTAEIRGTAEGGMYGIVNVPFANVAPTASADSSTTNEDIQLNVSAPGLLSNDSDPNSSQTLTASLYSGSPNADITVNPDGSFSYSPHLNYNGTDSFQYRVFDSVNYSSPATVSVTVNAVDDPPVLTGLGTTLDFTENSPAVTVAPGLTLTDSDGGTMTGGTVSITENFHPAEDALEYTTTNGISGAYNSTNGVLTLSGSGTTSDYQAALRAVTYRNSSDSPNTNSRTVSFAIGSTLYNPDNGHYYEFISSPSISWTAARDAAAGRQMNGRQGYLATITSAAENDFIASKLVGMGWIGASDAAVEGTWKWVTGPEGAANAGTGTVFCLGNNPCISQSGMYTHWNGGEPNNDATGAGEDYGHMIYYASPTTANGYWNDFPLNVGSIKGYIVEYGGMAGDNPQLTQNTVNVIAVNDAPVLKSSTFPLPNINEDVSSASNPGTSIGSLLGSNAVDAEGNTMGIAVIGRDADHGTWEFNQDGTWWNIDQSGAPSETNAKLLPPGVLIRFSPGTNYDGSSTMTFRAWDQTSGSAYSTADTSANGGSTPFSAETGTVQITMNPVNDPPVITGSDPTAVTMSEDGSPSAFALSLTATDVDMGDSLTWSIAGNPTNGTASMDSTGGTVAVHYTPTADFNGSDSFTVHVADNYGGTDTVVVNVTIEDVDDPPVLTGSGSLVSFTEDGTSTIVDPAIRLEDIDGGTITGATASITGNFHASEDVLEYTPSNGITGDYNASTGVLTLSGSGTATDYQAALRAVAYRNISQAPNPSPRTVSFAIGSNLYNDANGHYYQFVSSPGIRWDTARNAASVSRMNGLQGYLATITSAQENNFVSSKLEGVGWIGASDAGVEGVWKWVTGPESGTQFCSGDNPCTSVSGRYVNWNTSEPNNSGGDENYGHMIFNTAIGTRGSWNDLGIAGGSGDYAPQGYVVEYGGMPGDPELHLTANTTVDVVGVNDAPVIGGPDPAAVTMSEDGNPTAFSLSLTATDADVVDTLTWSIASHPTNGTASVDSTGGTIAVHYIPAANYNGSDAFTVQVSDGNGGTDTVVVNVTISPVNDAPVMGGSDPVSVTMSEDGIPTAFVLSLTATDVDGSDTLIWNVASNPSNGTASVDSSGGVVAVHYTPAADYNGNDSFTVQVSDGNGGVDSVVVNVAVNTVNDAPVLLELDSTLTSIPEDTANSSGDLVSEILPSSAVSDKDGIAIQALAVTSVDNTNGVWQYSTDGGSTWTGFGTPSDSSARLLNSAAKIRFVPTADCNGTSSFAFHAWDQTSGTSGGVGDAGVTGGMSAFSTETGTATITITPVNDAPVIGGLDPVVLTMSEDSNPTPFALSLNATDVDTGDSLTWSIASDPANGTASVDSSGGTVAVHYTPTADFNGSDSFAVQVADNNGGTDTVMVNVTIGAVNDAPVIGGSDPTAVTMSEDGNPTAFSLSLTATDADAGDMLTWSIASIPTNGTASVESPGETAAVHYTPSANYFGDDSFTVQVSDGNGGTDTRVVNVTVQPVNDAPSDLSLAYAISGGVFENQPIYTLVGGLTSTDIDSSAPFTYSFVIGPGDTDNSLFSITDSSLFTESILDFETHPAYTIRVKTVDGDGLSFEKALTITTLDGNEAPEVAHPIPDQTTAVGKIFSFVFAEDVFTDFNHDTLSYSAHLSTGAPLPAWLIFDAASRSFSGTPSASDAGVFTIRVTANDGNGGSVDDNFLIAVNQAGNQPPILADPIPDQTAKVGQSFSYSVAPGTFFDPDGDPLVYSVEMVNGNPLPGWLSFEPASQTFSGTSPSESSLQIKVTVEDGHGGVVSTVFSLNARTGNSAPVLQVLIPDQKAKAGTSFSYTLPPTTFHDPDDDPLTYTATLSNGDVLPAWLSFNPKSRVFSGTPAELDAGALLIHVTAADPNNGSTGDDFLLTVSNSQKILIPIDSRGLTENSPLGSVTIPAGTLGVHPHSYLSIDTTASAPVYEGRLLSMNLSRRINLVHADGSVISPVNGDITVCLPFSSLDWINAGRNADNIYLGTTSESVTNWEMLPVTVTTQPYLACAKVQHFSYFNLFFGKVAHAHGLPATGFEPGVVSSLPEQQSAARYAETDGMWLEIPQLGIKENIVGVPQAGDGNWDLTWLGDQIGWLEGTAFPTWSGNSLLTGHVYNSDGKPGPFIGLDQLSWGEQIIIHAWGQTYTYEVRSVSTVDPQDTSVFQHETEPWLTLITCKGFDALQNTYKSRLIVRAVQTKIE